MIYSEAFDQPNIISFSTVIFFSYQIVYKCFFIRLLVAYFFDQWGLVGWDHMDGASNEKKLLTVLFWLGSYIFLFWYYLCVTWNQNNYVNILPLRFNAIVVEAN